MQMEQLPFFLLLDTGYKAKDDIIQIKKGSLLPFFEFYKVKFSSYDLAAPGGKLAIIF